MKRTPPHNDLYHLRFIQVPHMERTPSEAHKYYILLSSLLNDTTENFKKDILNYLDQILGFVNVCFTEWRKPCCWEPCSLVSDQYMNACPVGLQLRQSP